MKNVLSVAPVFFFMAGARQIQILDNGNRVGQYIDIKDCGEQLLADIIRVATGRKNKFNVMMGKTNLMHKCRTDLTTYFLISPY